MRPTEDLVIAGTEGILNYKKLELNYPKSKKKL